MKRKSLARIPMIMITVAIVLVMAMMTIFLEIATVPTIEVRYKVAVSPINTLVGVLVGAKVKITVSHTNLSSLLLMNDLNNLIINLKQKNRTVRMVV